MAVALGQKLAILAADDAELERHSTVSVDACSLPEQITTLCWIAYANFNEGTATTVFLVRVSLQSVAQCPGTDLNQLHLAGEQLLLQDVCLLLGTSLGYLQLHAEDGQLLHRQRLHTTSAQTISARVSGMGKACARSFVLLMFVCSIAQSFLPSILETSSSCWQLSPLALCRSET